MSDMTLTVSIANYGHTTPLKDGSVTSDMFGMEHIEDNARADDIPPDGAKP